MENDFLRAATEFKVIRGINYQRESTKNFYQLNQ